MNPARSAAASFDPEVRARSTTIAAHECPEIAAPEGAVLDELRRLLATEKYATLEARLEDYDRAYTRNVACEGHVWTAYHDVAARDSDAEAAIDRWVGRRPDARAARLVRAMLHYTLGFDARGKELARDTSDEQFAAMRRRFEQALHDVMASRDMGALHMVAAGVVIRIARTSGDTAAATTWARELLEVDPLNYGVRRRLLHAHEPRWGGTLQGMQEVADAAQVYADRNPRLRALLGFPHAYRAMLAARERKHRDAIHHYSRALEHGDFGVDWSLARAKAYLELRQYAPGHEDIAYAKHWEPENVDAWALSARLYLAEEAWASAIPELDRALALEPADPFKRADRGWAHEKLGHWEAAATDYRAALDVEPTAWRAAHLGIVLFRGLGRTGEAIEHLQLASRLDPNDREIWFQLAQAQAAVGQEAAAAASYRRFLEQAKQPGDDARIDTARRHLR